MQDDAATALEWTRVLDAVALSARSSMGVARCRALPLETELEAARARLRETAEMVALSESLDPFPALSFPDIRVVLGRAVKGATLETVELRDVSLALAVMEEARRYLARHREAVPALADLGQTLERLDGVSALHQAIDRAIDPDGGIRESATPELAHLSHQVQGLKHTMRRRLEVILTSTRYAEVLQEHYFAQREGRYVVPLKAELRSRIPGIVHDISASGATVFLEPRELVDLNNAIKVAELEVAREVTRILHELSRAVAAQASAWAEALEALATLDCVAAKAAFSRQVRGVAVTVQSGGRIAVRQARHPLLALARDEVVANDILLEESVRVLIISGPNTGGKTVTLKLVGLFALMVRAGLQLPCAQDSEMGLFPRVFADIGDAQDLARDLSSFSAHMTKMISLLKAATANDARASGPTGLLVLLDEPVTSTDPAEGAALAEALLMRLAQLGATVVATTHYNPLKLLAQSTPGFMNASVEFDVSRLAPTYRLIMNRPGGSSAIDIAGRLGMDEAVLEDALERVCREDRSLETTLSELQETQRRLDAELARAKALREHTERAARDASDIAERLRTTERDERKSAKRKLTDEVLRARAEVQAVLEGLKREPTLTKAKAAKQRLADLASAAHDDLVPVEERVPLAQLRTGDQVELVALGLRGILLGDPRGKKRVRVRVGDRELSVEVSTLVGLAGRRGEAAPTATAPVQRASASMPAAPVTAPDVVDVRGKTAEEALDLTIAALDQAMLAGAARLRIIHGHGTGRLKGVLRDYLKHSEYVAASRAGERAEGGDGVTIVDLR